MTDSTRRLSSLLFATAVLGVGFTACRGELIETTTDTPVPREINTGGGGGSDVSADCAVGLQLCQGLCTDVATSSTHCGTCDNTCSAGTECIGGTCSCGSGLRECNGTCTSVETDAQNCGTCGTACATNQTCNEGQCACPGELTSCGNECVNAAADLSHCGVCDRACSTGETCDAGECVCLPGLTSCESGCTDLQSDPDNCGTCGEPCGDGQVCSAGQCAVTCDTGLAVCGQSCVDLMTNVNHCGECGTTCGAGRTCSSGDCSCTGGLLECNGSCVDAQTSATHCGRCGNACPQGQTCSGGSCSCPGGQTACSGRCVNTATDSQNCGTCGTTCTGGRSCSNGTCTCSAGQTWCSSACVNTQTDPANCGACGRACTAGQTCSNGTCTGGSTNRVFSQCRFHFGTIDNIAKANATMRAQLDFFTPGWMGLSDTFDQGYVCDETKPGAVLEHQVPVIVAYVAAFYAKRKFNLCDCNVNTCGTNNDLCHYGSQRIQQNLTAILNVYRSYAQGYASCFGTTRPIIFEMEPDFYQYTISTQTDPMTPAEAGAIMSQFVGAIKQYLPNAVFSMDISPWVPPNNGSDHGAQWYSNFDMSLFTFIHTSGGSTEAANTRIRSSNNMTWAGVSQVTGKPILADTGYGANGVSAGHDANWDNPTYIKARMADGVVSISQYNPNSNWGNTISQIRPQLTTAPRFCP